MAEGTPSLHASLAAAAPLCLPVELMHGYWSDEPLIQYKSGKASMRPRHFLRGKLNKTSQWHMHQACLAPAQGSAATALSLLRSANVSIVFSGNSIMRHVFFRFASYLRGVPTDEFTQDERQAEKDVCTKEVFPQTTSRGVAGAYRKPFCKNGCCGVCSCASSVAGIGLYFVWQQEWYDERMRQVWDELLSSEPLRGRTTFLVMNAGLVHAKLSSLQCIMRYQFPMLRHYLLGGLPSHVRTIYMASTPAQGEEADAWMGAQDGMLRTLFSAIPPRRRPVWLDARTALSDWVDYIDVNHFGGRSAQVIIDALVHIVGHWERLYTAGGRGWEFERQSTKRLNQYDNGPSSGAWLLGAQRDSTGVSNATRQPLPPHQRATPNRHAQAHGGAAARQGSSQMHGRGTGGVAQSVVDLVNEYARYCPLSSTG
jgi:hypothetical protein